VSEVLYPYYERELIFIRQLGQEFAKRYPAAAGRLLLESERTADPHVARLVQAFALLAGRIHYKLDDEFPELTESLLAILYPHYLAPVPSMSIVQFELDPARSKLPDGFRIPRHSRVRSQPIGTTHCRFRTGYPVTLWPVTVAAAEFLLPPFPTGILPPPKTAAVLRLELECQSGLTFSELSLDRLRFYISFVGPLLYEFLFHNALRVVFRSPERSSGLEPVVKSPEDCLHPVGFEADEGLIPYPRQSFPGYRLLTEFFLYPSKFMFFDLSGFRELAAAKFSKRVEVLIFLDRGGENLENAITAETFCLGCSPVVNLFEQVAEPVPLSHARYEYKVVPDVAHQEGMEVYSVDGVTCTDPVAGKSWDYQPFYSLRHTRGRDEGKAFWYASRRPSLRENDKGTDVFLTLVDLNFDPHLPADANLIIRTTCTNRDLPNALRQAGERLAFELEAAAPLKRVRCLRSPSPTLRPPLRRGAHWRLISHLNLNYLSLSDDEQGLEALREILRLYDFSETDTSRPASSINDQIIEGLLSVKSRRVVGHTPDMTDGEGGFCRGVEVTVELDEDRFMGTGMFLFACVLEKFLGLYVSINSFTQLIVRSRPTNRLSRRWAPRAGEQRLL
jgi:type VI secretion system protein ImpG